MAYLSMVGGSDGGAPPFLTTFVSVMAVTDIEHAKIHSCHSKIDCGSFGTLHTHRSQIRER